MTIDMSQEDINRTYGDTFIGVRSADKILPVYVVGGTERSTIEARVYNEDGTHPRRTFNLNDEELVLSYPDSGAFNVGEGNAAFVSRHAQRQWRRGIAQRHLSITGDISFDYQLVHGMFNPTYTPYSQALEMIADTKKYSAAIDRNFWLRRMPMYTNPIIMFRNTCVGEIKDGEVKIKDKSISHLFKEAISENP